MTDPSVAGGPDPLLALFRQEADAQAMLILDGLAELAIDPRNPDRYPPLERAAAQMRSAALVVGAGPAAALARAAADALAAGQQQPGAFTPARAAEVRQAVEQVRAFAAAAVDPDHPPPSADAAADLAARLAAAPVPPPPPPPPVGAVSWHDWTLPEDAWPPAASPVPPPPPPAPIVPSTPPKSAVAASLMSDSHAATLLELFREEVRSLTAALSSGLVELESHQDPRTVEPLMRAAHSIKGAARIVGCQPGVDLAHVMEELLVAAQKGARPVGPADVDAMLAGVDLLARMADTDLQAWAAENGPAIARSTEALAAMLAGKPAPAAPPAAVPTASPAAEPVAPAADEDWVVRISANSLSRLLSLAGESLVEARWLQPFARSLTRLRKHQDHTAAVLDDLHQILVAGAPADRVAAAAEDARRRLADCRRVLAERIDEFETHARQSDDLNSRLYREVIASRMRPFADGTYGLARMVRDVARQLGKQVRFEVLGKDTDVDRDILDKLDAPLGHLLRNALDHGIEPPADRAAAGKPPTAALRAEARHVAGMLVVTVSDDGRGIDVERVRRKVVEKKLTAPDLAAKLSEAEVLEFLFLPGFSTAATVTEVSGRGVGLDAVQAMAQGVGGQVRVSTRAGRGTAFELMLPITLSVVRAVLVRIGGDPYAMPLNRTDRLLRLPTDRVRTLEGKPHFEADGRHVGLVPAHLVFDQPAPPVTADELAVVLIGDRHHQYGLVVEGLLGEQDLVVRPLDGRLGKVPNVAAAALLDDGSPVLIVDVDDVLRTAAGLVQEGKLRGGRPADAPKRRRKRRVLVVDDSAIVREAERQLLAARGYEVELAVDGADGWNAVRGGGFDLVVSDIDMPRMTGLELVRAVRADPKVSSTPIVIVSYKDRDEDRARGLDAGANYYLTKSSFHDGRFVQAVEELIGGPDG